jgi:hypothetical protein
VQVPFVCEGPGRASVLCLKVGFRWRIHGARAAKRTSFGSASTAAVGKPHVGGCCLAVMTIAARAQSASASGRGASVTNSPPAIGTTLQSKYGNASRAGALHASALLN